MATMVINKTDAKEIADTLPTDVLNRIMQLRRVGMSNYDISEEMNLPYPHVVQFAIISYLKKNHGDTKKIKRRAEEARLEHLFQQAHQAFVATGTVDWYDRLLKTSERKSKLLGLDAPAETVMTGKKGGPIQFETMNLSGLSDAELATMKALALKSIKAEES